MLEFMYISFFINMSDEQNTDELSSVDLSTEELKNVVLAKEKEHEYQSDAFSEVEKQVKDALSHQATDDALREVSV